MDRDPKTGDTTHSRGQWQGMKSVHFEQWGERKFAVFLKRQIFGIDDAQRFLAETIW